LDLAVRRRRVRAGRWIARPVRRLHWRCGEGVVFCAGCEWPGGQKRSGAAIWSIMARDRGSGSLAYRSLLAPGISAAGAMILCWRGNLPGQGLGETAPP
jgi:hypothetical protein